MDNIIVLEKHQQKTDKISSNLRRLFDAHHVTESEVAQALNLPIMTIKRLLSGETTDPRISTLKQIANYFNVSLDMLTEDNSNQPIALMQKATTFFIPVLNWNILSSHSINDIDLTQWSNWKSIAIDHDTTLSKQSFALESRPSMQPRFPIGTLFIIDPAAEPQDGDMCLIKMKSDGSVSLRKLIVDSPRWQLQPIIAGSDTLFLDKDQHQMIGIVMLSLLHSR